MFRTQQFLRQALAGLASFAALGAAQAASFGVSPVRAELDAARPIASFVVRNQANVETVVQVDVNAWRQQDGADVLEPTGALIATPPIATIPPGGQQVVRVGLKHPATGATEQSFRVLLQEVPPPPPPGFQGMRMALRMSIPVFVLPATPGKPALAWRAKRVADGSLAVAVANSGTAHAQVTSLQVTAADGKPLVPTPLSGYVLPGQSHEWRVPANAARELRVSGTTTTGAIDETLALDAD